MDTASSQERFGHAITAASGWHKAQAYEQAEAAYLELLKEFPNASQLHYLLGILYWDKGHPNKAKECLKEAISIESKDEYLIALAEIHYNSYEDTEAVAAFEKALEQDPNSYKLLKRLGNAYLRNGNLNKAEQILRKAFNNEPERPESHSALGHLFLKQDKVDWAIGAFQSALEKDAKHLPAMLGIGQAVQARGNFQQADHFLRKALAAHPDAYECHLRLGDLFFQENKLEWAIGAFQSTIERNKHSAEAYLALSRVHEVKSDYKKALEASERAYSLYPRSKDIGLAYGRQLLQCGQVEKGQALLKEAVSDGSTGASDCEHLAYALLNSGLKDMGSYWLREALRTKFQFSATQ